VSNESKEDRLTAALSSGDEQTRLDAIMRIAREPTVPLSGLALGRVVECLGSDRKLIQRRAADALAAAANHDPGVVAALREALESANPRRRWGAAYTLGVIGDALDLRTQKALLEALSNPDGDVRWAAAELIVRLGAENPDVVRRGLIGLETHADHNTRKMALYCLRDLKFGDAEVRAMVKRASRGAEPGVRLAVLSLLAHLDDADDESAEIAMRCLAGDPDPGVRRAAAIALGHLARCSPRVREALERAANQDDDPDLGKAARTALARLERSV
jgi:HEAT repeat protein